MNFRELVKKHPSVIGLIIGACILLFIIFTIVTQQK